MLKIQANKLKTQGINITEEVYIRVAFTTRFGEQDINNPNNVLSWLQYKAFVNIDDIKNIDIDGLDNAYPYADTNDIAIINVSRTQLSHL